MSGGVEVPFALRAWGALIMGVGGLAALVLLVLLARMAYPLGGLSGIEAYGTATCFRLAICGAVAGVGRGLWQGRRSAVVAATIFTIVGILMVGVFSGSAQRDAPGVVVSIIAGLVAVFAPPVLVGFARWDDLR